jgi:hypothetical protein
MGGYSIAGWAKQVATNGAPNVFAYLGQYFTNHHVIESISSKTRLERSAGNGA